MNVPRLLLSRQQQATHLPTYSRTAAPPACHPQSRPLDKQLAAPNGDAGRAGRVSVGRVGGVPLRVERFGRPPGHAAHLGPHHLAYREKEGAVTTGGLNCGGAPAKSSPPLSSTPTSPLPSSPPHQRTSWVHTGCHGHAAVCRRSWCSSWSCSCPATLAGAASRTLLSSSGWGRRSSGRHALQLRLLRLQGQHLGWHHRPHAAAYHLLLQQALCHQLLRRQCHGGVGQHVCRHAAAGWLGQERRAKGRRQQGTWRRQRARPQQASPPGWRQGEHALALLLPTDLSSLSWLMFWTSGKGMGTWPGAPPAPGFPGCCCDMDALQHMPAAAGLRSFNQAAGGGSTRAPKAQGAAGRHRSGTKAGGSGLLPVLPSHGATHPAVLDCAVSGQRAAPVARGAARASSGSAGPQLPLRSCGK